MIHLKIPLREETMKERTYIRKGIELETWPGL